MSSGGVVFDDIQELLREKLRAINLPNNAPTIFIIRDTFGKVGVSAPDEHESDEDLRNALEGLAQVLHDGAGARGSSFERFVLWLRPELINKLERTAQEIIPGVKLADRLLVGASWWTVGPDEAEGPTRYTLYSVKGGVGRSTTAAILAWHLARKGEDVLAIDLDLESPGLASAFLETRMQPNFGVADWFVEELVGQGDALIEQITASPVWTNDLPGTVWIAPAHGHGPGEYLAKLGRVYMDTAVDPWTKRLRRLLKQLEDRLKPTVTILESRSGLHDIAAATVTDIGAEVMLFAVDSPASWTGYGILFDHWRRLGLASQIRERLSVVSALTPELDTERYLSRFRENSWDLFRENLYDTLRSTSILPDSVSYAFEEDDAPHSPLVVNWNRGLAAGASLRKLETTAVGQAYRPFLRSFDRRHQARHKAKTPIPVSGDNFRVADRESVRIALTKLPEGTNHGARPRPNQLYLPHSHRKALDPNVSLVIGGRGTGKTFWWSALQDESVLPLLKKLHARLAPIAKSDMLAGFGVVKRPQSYPSPQEIGSLVQNDKFKPRIVWQTIHAHHLADTRHPLRKLNMWDERTKYVYNNPREIARLLDDCDNRLDRKGKYSIVLFDGLDRSTNDWRKALELTSGLLQHALEMRSYRRLRAKVFLRPDHIEESSTANFPDSSKILSTAVQLTWRRRALYSMLWQYLGNGDSGAILRRRLAEGDWMMVDVAPDMSFYKVPLPLASDEEIQRELFHSAITGPWMGTDRRRGFPYTWIPNHLADADGTVSPRSFIAAVKAAARDTAERHPNCKYALHYDSIKRGVREASKIRVREIQEDYPWVGSLLQLLSGIVVPCKFEDIAKVWRSKEVIKQLSGEAAQNEVKLPPPNLEWGEIGIRGDLEVLGIFRRLRDGRVDIPDVFRIAYGLGRKGGVNR